MNNVTRAFLDELNGISKIAEDPDYGNPREFRKSLYRRLLEGLGIVSSDIERRNQPQKKRY